MYRGHALSPRTRLKRDAGQYVTALTTFGMHPDFQIIPDQHLLYAELPVQRKAGLAFAAQLKTTREKLYTDGQLIEIAPYTKPGQGKKNIISKKEPESLLVLLTHVHTTIIEERLIDGGRQTVVPAHPEHMAHSAHVHVLAFRQTG